MTPRASVTTEFATYEDDAAATHSVAYVEAFVAAALTVHSKFEVMVREVFDAEPSFVALLVRLSQPTPCSLNAGRKASRVLIVSGACPTLAEQARCCRLYLNSTSGVAELLACYCALQLTASPVPTSAPLTPTASLLSKASAAFGFGGGEARCSRSRPGLRRDACRHSHSRSTFV